jgi:PAS domain-containing protein
VTALEFFTWLAALSTGAISAMVYLRRPPAPIWPSLFYVTLTAMLWTLGEAGSSFIAATPPRYWFWLTVQYTGVLFVPATWWFFTLRFAELQGLAPQWAGRAARVTPYGLMLFAWLAMITNPWHGQFMVPHMEERNEFRLIWYLQAGVGYVLMIGVLGLFTSMLRATRDRVLREQLLIMLAASVFPLLCNAVYVSGLVGTDVGITAAGLGFSMVLFLVGIYRDRLFGLSSLSMQQLIEHDTDGMLILDRDGRLRHFNPAATRLLTGETLTPDMDLVPVLASHLRSGDGKLEFSKEDLQRALGSTDQPPSGHTYPFDGDGCRWLGIEVTPIPDRAGQRHGTGLRLSDVTALHEA